MLIETERLMLRPFETKDVQDLYSYLHTPSVHCFMDMKLETMEDARNGIAERMNDTTGLYLAIVLKENGKVIGELFAGPESTDPTDSVQDTYSPCWMLNSDYQGKGYAYEAAHAYYDLLFNKMSARRIYT
ncbi:MAG: GNAT family N-acetyltransferase [Oscillospiraceae bacterium]|nr:GNAT family N-acetyltransferase [Oscillospiraceae bacterium]